MPAGKRREVLSRASSAGFDAAFTARLLEAVRTGLARLDRLTIRREERAGVADDIPARAPAARVRRFFGLPIGRAARAPIDARAEALMNDLQAVSRSRPLADPELAQERVGLEHATALPAPRRGKDVAA